ncbi:unnamed protein product [Discula destructiva]
MPYNPAVNQRALRKEPCKICSAQLVVSGALSYGMIHELWRSPFPTSTVARVLKYGVCAYSLLPVMTFFMECLVDPSYCNPVHGHLFALRFRDLVMGIGYWAIGRLLGPLEVEIFGDDAEETGPDDVD